MQCLRGKRHGARTRIHLGGADLVIAIRALAHVQFTGFQIDVGPAQAAKLA